MLEMTAKKRTRVNDKHKTHVPTADTLGVESVRMYVNFSGINLWNMPKSSEGSK